MKKAMWIWNKAGAVDQPEMVAFRKHFTVDVLPKTYMVDVCADSRYILFVNGTRAAAGPARGGTSDRYYDTLDLSPYLIKGDNVLYAEAIHYAETPLTRNGFLGGPISVETTPIGGFLVRDGGALELSTDESWECGSVDGYEFVRASSDFMYLGYTEKRVYGQETNYRPAVVCYNSEPYTMGGLANIWSISPRPIPFTYEKKERFCRPLYCDGVEERDVQGLLSADAAVTVPPHSEVCFLVDPGLYKTGFPYAVVEGGAGAQLQLRYTEKFNAAHMRVYAERHHFPDEMTDVFVTDGSHRELRPFLYRAFRYITIAVKTAEAPLRLLVMGLYRTGYPLDIQGSYTADNTAYDAVWKTSLNTLESCMYETYMDCPYYEQMQYAMDSMLEMIYSYQVSSDDRLARKAIDDFARAQLYDGMFPCATPAGFTQIIPGFSIYWIMMLHDHYRYYADVAFIEKYTPELEKLLSFYIRHLCPETGLIVNTGYWQFVDWVDEWNRGCPSAKEDNYIYSMMISYAFRLSSELFAAMGDVFRARKYMQCSDDLNASINIYAWNETEQVYLDAPDGKTRSQHAQLWAVLSDACGGQRAVDIMTSALDGSFSKASYCMSYFLFRALEKVGMYERTRQCLTQWERFVEEGATTWPEDPVTRRSECHAWGAVPLYDFAACHLGVTPLAEGYKKVAIEPKALWLEQCKGSVATCKGTIRVSWTRHKEDFTLEATFPEKMNVQLTLPNGKIKTYDHVQSIRETCTIGLMDKAAPEA